jgi:hypothetical protein
MQFMHNNDAFFAQFLRRNMYLELLKHCWACQRLLREWNISTSPQALESKRLLIRMVTISPWFPARP